MVNKVKLYNDTNDFLQAINAPDVIFERFINARAGDKADMVNIAGYIMRLAQDLLNNSKKEVNLKNAAELLEKSKALKKLADEWAALKENRLLELDNAESTAKTNTRNHVNT